MFPNAKAQFDLALAWQELALTAFAASTSMANAGGKVVAASDEAQRIAKLPKQGPEAFFAPWTALMTPSAAIAAPIDPMRFAEAATQATVAFWSTLLGSPVKSGAQPSRMPNINTTPAKPAPQPLPLPLPMWWTAFTEPAASASKQPAARAPAPQWPFLH